MSLVCVKASESAPAAKSVPAKKTAAIYTLSLCTGSVDRTTWWKDCNIKEPANVWWLEGGGESRPATPVEIELWQQLQAAKALPAEAAQ